MGAAMAINPIGALGSLVVNLAGAVAGLLLITSPRSECLCFIPNGFSGFNLKVPELTVGNSYFGEAGHGPQQPLDRKTDRIAVILILW